MRLWEGSLGSTVSSITSPHQATWQPTPLLFLLSMPKPVPSAIPGRLWISQKERGCWMWQGNWAAGRSGKAKLTCTLLFLPDHIALAPKPCQSPSVASSFTGASSSRVPPEDHAIMPSCLHWSRSSQLLSPAYSHRVIPKSASVNIADSWLTPQPPSHFI